MRKLIGVLTLVLFFQTTFGQELNETRVFFIRHAEKVKSGDTDPALTKIGQKRAIYWAQVFKDNPFDAIYSTQTIRTVSTALPTSEQCKVEISIYDDATVDIKALVEKHKGETILIVGHSDTTPTLVNSLLGEDRYEQIESNNNSNLYIVDYADETAQVILLHIELVK